jgi:predicted lipoprotein with Yx(FWY)xxD motif
LEVPSVFGKALIGVGGLAVALAAAGCASSGSSGSAASSNGGATTVSARNVAGVGTTLVDSHGDTLYFSDEESSGTVRCVGACLHFWVPVTVASGATPTAGSGVTGHLATIARPDGPTQVTFDGRPLYRFSLDSAGQAKGNGFTDSFDGTDFRWHAAALSGTASPAPASSNPNGYGY